MAQIDLRNATIRLADGGSNYIELKIAEGNLEYTEKREIDFVKSRGVLDTVRQNEDQPVEISTQFIWDFIYGGSTSEVTIEDSLKQRGNAAGWVSASPDAKAPYCVNVEIIYIPVCPDVKSETLVLGQFHYIELAHSLKDGTVALKGNCNTTEAVSTRS